MMLPPSCKVIAINPRKNFTMAQTSSWRTTDLQHSLVLSKLSHVIVMYQFTGFGPRDDYYIATCIKINSDIQKHTVAHSGRTIYFGNFGLWQGSLGSGTHTAEVMYCSRVQAMSQSKEWETRALTIIPYT